jgi:glucose-fructose oxidoreductase
MDARSSPIRYAVVGLGHIAQFAVLPAFTNAGANCELVALVSGNATKLQEVGKQYGIANLYRYEEYDRLLHSGIIDAVFVALPNNMHCEYSVRAAEAGAHVLCEKPMAVTEDECRKMIAAAEASDVRLMIAYRLHFEKANLEAIRLVHAGAIGEPRIFTSAFSQQVKEDDIRLQGKLGGGSVYDIGVYCINAARYLFRDEPIEVVAQSVSSGDCRFEEVDEMTSAVLRFPRDRLASFTCSFGAADVSSYRVIGTTGDLRLEPAYDHQVNLSHHLTVNGRTKRKTFVTRDQFAAELLYFSRCVQEGEPPEPSGHEGLADVRIIEAIYRSAREKSPCMLEPLQKTQRPTPEQEIHKPTASKPPLVMTQSPSY